MTIQRRQCGMLLLAGLLCSPLATAGLSGSALVAKELGWVWKPTARNFCPGHFEEPTDIQTEGSPPPFNQAKTRISTPGEVSFSSKKTSVLRGRVTVRQPGRKLTADNVKLIRNHHTGRISVIEMRGNVQYTEIDHKFIGQYARFDLENNYARVNNAAYRILHLTNNEQLSAWGTALLVQHHSNKNITLTNTTYTTCAPNACVWELRAQTICLKHLEGEGVARNATLRLFSIPILYLPYFSFPLDQNRKSGILIPSLGYANDNGLELEIPYYLNLAPNYDAIVAANIMTNRGVQLKAHVRYLTCHSQGDIKVEFLPYDREFKRFQDDAPFKIGDDPNQLPFLSRIENSSLYRYWISGTHRYSLDPHWSSSLILSYVSDDYYLHDFGNNPVISNTDQLLNMADVHYVDCHWNLMGRLQAYQSLHPLNSISPEPYSRVPQLFAHAYYPQQLWRFDCEFTGDYNYFDHRNFFVSNTPVVTGGRLHVQPAVHLPLQNASAYFTPSLRLDVSEYWLNNQDPDVSNNINRTLPIFNIDSGIFFERHFPLNRCDYRQTLEPRAYYLYVPRKDQSEIPLFDTSQPSFNYEQLFYYNRFVGFDRINDANQLAFAITSRLLTDHDGVQFFSASIGTIYYFKSPKVTLSEDQNLPSQAQHSHWSPIIGMVDLHLASCINATGVWAWNPRDNTTDNFVMNFHYQSRFNPIFNAGYEFVRDGDEVVGETNNNLSRINLSLSYPVRNYHFLANWNYNLSHSHPQSYFFGIGYESCCWGIRGIISRTILEANQQDNNKYDNKFYLQFKLKGLGTVGNNDPSHLLQTGITGYHDLFRSAAPIDL